MLTGKWYTRSYTERAPSSEDATRILNDMLTCIQKAPVPLPYIKIGRTGRAVTVFVIDNEALHG